MRFLHTSRALALDCLSRQIIGRHWCNKIYWSLNGAFHPMMNDDDRIRQDSRHTHLLQSVVFYSVRTAHTWVRARKRSFWNVCIIEYRMPGRCGTNRGYATMRNLNSDKLPHLAACSILVLPVFVYHRLLNSRRMYSTLTRKGEKTAFQRRN